jgi:hypothetical protein
VPKDQGVIASLGERMFHRAPSPLRQHDFVERPPGNNGVDNTA